MCHRQEASNRRRPGHASFRRPAFSRCGRAHRVGAISFSLRLVEIGCHNAHCLRGKAILAGSERWVFANASMRLYPATAQHRPILSIERICAGLPAQVRSRQTLGKRQLKQEIQAMPIRKLRCSFCRKTENQVAKLVGGRKLAFCPEVYICDECVAAANLIMQGNTPPIPEVSSSLQKLKERWRHLLRRSVLREASFARTP